MLRKKAGTSIISLVLCFVAIALVTTALVVANNNSAKYKAKQVAKEQLKVDSLAYVKVYTLDEVKQIAKQSFADNYLSLYENEVSLAEFEALVLGDVANKITLKELDKYAIYVTPEGVTVEYK